MKKGSPHRGSYKWGGPGAVPEAKQQLSGNSLFILYIEINEASFCIQLNEEAGLQCAAQQGSRFTQAQEQVFIREQSQAVSNPEKQAAVYIFYTHCQHPHTAGRRFCHFPGPDPEQALPCPWVWGIGLCLFHSSTFVPDFFLLARILHSATAWLFGTCLGCVRIWV